MSRGVRLLLGVLRFIGAVVAAAVAGELVGYWMMAGAHFGPLEPGVVSDLSLTALTCLVSGLLAGLVAAVIAHPRHWLWVGLAPGLLFLTVGMVFGLPSLRLAGVPPSAALLLGGSLGAAAVHALRKRKARAAAARVARA